MKEFRRPEFKAEATVHTSNPHLIEAHAVVKAQASYFAGNILFAILFLKAVLFLILQSRGLFMLLRELLFLQVPLIIEQRIIFRSFQICIPENEEKPIKAKIFEELEISN